MTYAAFGLWLYMISPEGVNQGPYHLDTHKTEELCKVSYLATRDAMQKAYPGWKLTYRCYPGQDT